MSYVDGVGDEVLGLLVSVLATFLVAVLWKTTQVRDAPPIHHVVIQGDRIRAFGFSTNPAAANRARASASANSTTDGASEDQNLQFHPTTTKLSECLRRFRRRQGKTDFQWENHPP